ITAFIVSQMFCFIVFPIPIFLLETPRNCKLWPRKGKCKENFTRFYYDRTTKICKPFKFGGCNGNRNNFLNQEDCMQECKPV
uniref:BPTI/Kunitz inhibitor domain-containing protein n=1 Tax=Pseudonaja textilis TaxID=8673 RepID=A0A670YQT4_PSETE